MKKLSTLLLLALLFTACTERGYTLKPVTQTTTPKKTVLNKTKEAKVVQKVKKASTITTKTLQVTLEKPTIKKSIVQPITTQKPTQVKEESFFTLSEETKNKVSGFLILVIGIIILL